MSAIDSQGRTIWIADAHRGDGKRYVVQADEPPAAFANPTARQSANCVLQLSHEDRHYFICIFIAPVRLPDHEHN